MSYFAGTPIIRSPAQASQVFGPNAPRQRHVFLVRFYPNVHAGLPVDVGGLTFVVKNCDRPKAMIKTEEMNQYNKKRQVHTGFKYEPMKIVFWDSANGAAQNLWNAYAKYYFGDFELASLGGYSRYDVTEEHFEAGAGYGMTEGYGLKGAKGLNNAQWFFSSIEIFHFYHGLYDKYMLINPRITSYTPDDLDYETASVCQITMQFAFENVHTVTGQATGPHEFSEFSGSFDGHPLQEQAIRTTLDETPGSTMSPVNPSIQSLLRPKTSTQGAVAAYRAAAAPAPVDGSLSNFGSFSFGSGSSPTTTIGGQIGGAQFDASTAPLSNALSTGYGSLPGDLASAVLSTGPDSIGSPFMSASAYSAYNANTSGTAQIGFNSDYAPTSGLGPQPSAPEPQTNVASPLATVLSN